MTRQVLMLVCVASIMLACTPGKTHFVTNTGYEALAKRKAKDAEQRIFNSNYLVSCNLVLGRFADCAVLITPDLSAYRVYCSDGDCLAQRVPAHSDREGGKDE